MIIADRIVIHDHPPAGQVYAPDAFEGNVGRTIRLILEDGTVTHAQVLRVEIMPCGGVNITLEVSPWN